VNLADATARLAAAGVRSPRVDAELLLAHVLGVERPALLRGDATLDGESAARFTALVARRAGREPVQYLIGSAPFRYATLVVGPGVFIPRPETELLVDAVRPGLRAGAIAVDLCAGSGALAVALAGEVAGLRAVAVENSEAALTWLGRNAAAAGVEVVTGDVADASLLTELDGRVDAVVSNPPYVPDGITVDAEVHHDPAAAVFAGPDGLAVIPAVVRTAARLLRPGGVLALEHDETHQAAVLALLDPSSWTDATGHSDLTGRDRYVTARRR
jgi:release factor glutamine methyltransferase